MGAGPKVCSPGSSSPGSDSEENSMALRPEETVLEGRRELEALSHCGALVVMLGAKRKWEKRNPVLPCRWVTKRTQPRDGSSATGKREPRPGERA